MSPLEPTPPPLSSPSSSLVPPGAAVTDPGSGVGGPDAGVAAGLLAGVGVVPDGAPPVPRRRVLPPAALRPAVPAALPRVRVLGVDPSLRGTGYAVLETGGTTSPRGHAGYAVRTLVYGTIKNRSDLLPSGCLVRIHEQLTDVIGRYEPDCCAVEAVIFVQSHRTAITLGAARGAAILAAAARGLTIQEYAPRLVKQAVVGRGGADKTQVAFMVRALLGLTETPPPDAADALAIGLTHLRAHENTVRHHLPDDAVRI